MEPLERKRRFEDVMQVLANELECCQSIYDVTIEIGAMIQSDEIGTLISKLVEREHLIRQMQCFEEELRSLIAQWGASPTEHHGASGTFHRTAEQIRSLIASIVSLDEAHKNVIMDREGDISVELRRVREGRTLLRTYFPLSSREGRVVDRVVE